MPDPNIHGGTRTVSTAAIVLACGDTISRFLLSPERGVCGYARGRLVFSPDERMT